MIDTNLIISGDGKVLLSVTNQFGQHSRLCDQRRRQGFL